MSEDPLLDKEEKRYFDELHRTVSGNISRKIRELIASGVDIPIYEIKRENDPKGVNDEVQAD